MDTKALSLVLCALLLLMGGPSLGAEGGGPEGAGRARGTAHGAGFWDAVGGATADKAAANQSGAAAQADRIVSSMSDADLLGQTLMFGYIGTDPSPAIIDWIRDRHIGGVKIFTRNVADLPGLARGVARMQSFSQAGGARIPLFIATDQEGGWVRHIKLQTSVSPGNLALGASRLPRDAYLTGAYLGKELFALGINMDFAPTVDVYANPQASVIGPRSFGSDPEETALLAAAYVRGMRSAGVLCTAKHFPGHGSADKDSHGHVSVVNADMDTLRSRDLVPYRILAKEEVPAIMSAHIAFPSILGDLTPSSLSPYFLRTILRDEIGFRGIVITDDMEMEGVLNGGLDAPTACRLALEAGNDMVLISHSPPTQTRAWDYLLSAMRARPGFRSTVKASARRIIETKLRYFRPGGGASALIGAPAAAAPAPGKAEAHSSMLDGLAAAIPAPGASEFFFQSSCRSVSLVAGRLVPLRPTSREKVLLCGQFEEFIAEGKARYPKADTLLYPFNPFYAPRADDLTRIPGRCGEYDTVIFCLANFNSLEILKKMRGMARKLVVISALTPVYLSEVPWVQTAVAVYGSGRDSFRAGFAVLAGDYAPTTAVPVKFEAAAKK
jgi:beta-N-acetylhexosaminidase